MMRPIPLTSAVISVLTLPSVVMAAEGDAQPSGTLPPVTVVAPLAQPTSPSIQQAREETAAVPGAASVVDTQRYQQGATGSLATFLDLVPGVFAQSQAGGQDTRLSIRGSGIQADGILGVIFLQDGIPINEGDGEVDIEEFDLGNIRYAEVYRGADALRYGGLGLGGAINLVSLTGKDVGLVSGRFEAGSYGYHQEHVSSGYATGPWDWVVAIGSQHTDGYRDHSTEDTQRIAANLGYQLTPTWQNRVYFSYIRLDRDLPDDLSKDDLDNDPRSTSQDSIDQDFHRHWWETRVSDRLSYVEGARSLDIAASANHRWWREQDIYTVDDPEGVWMYQSNGVTGDITFADRTPWWGRANQFTIGVLPTWEVEPDHYYENDGGQAGAAIAADRTVAFNSVWFIEDRHALTKQLSVVLGAQLVNAHRTYRDEFEASPTFGETDSQSFTGFNPKLGVIFEPAEKIQVFANLSRSFQPPSFDDLVQLGDGSGPLYAYVPLEAQTATTVEFGTRSARDGIEWDLAIYRSWIRNELLEVNDALGVDLGTVNASPTYHQGIEAGLTLDLLGGDGHAPDAHHLLLEQSYTYNDFHFSDDAVYGHNRIAGIPIHFYRASLIYQHPCGFYIGPQIEWNITRYPVDEANTLSADQYVLIGARAGWAWHDRVHVFVEGTNLGNRTYAAVVAPIPDARTDPDPAVFRSGTGRAVVGGIEASW